jgi:hypothetical protein
MEMGHGIQEYVERGVLDEIEERKDICVGCRRTNDAFASQTSCHGIRKRIK